MKSELQLLPEVGFLESVSVVAYQKQGCCLQHKASLCMGCETKAVPCPGLHKSSKDSTSQTSETEGA